MNFKSNTTLGKITFYISLFILIYIFYTTFHDIIFPINFDNPKKVSIIEQYNIIITLGIMYISIINFILGIITLFQKASNKKCSIITLIICTPLALSGIIGCVQGLMIRFGI